MRDALERIDEVGKYEGSDQDVYDQRVKVAKQALLICHKRQITAYDKQLMPLMDMQLDGAEAEHKARIGASTDPLYARMLIVEQAMNHDSEAMLRAHLQ